MAPSEWFALTVKPRHEKLAAEHLRARGLEAFLPLYHARRKWSDRLQAVDLPLFPGYLFCRFTPHHWLQVLSAPGVQTIVSFGRRPLPVGEAEISAVQSMLSSGLPVLPWQFIHAGDRVEIKRGPLAGMRGLAVREKGVDRFVVNVELLQRAVAVEIDREFLMPVRSQRAA